MVDEIDTDLTRGSIGAARSVCETLSENDALSRDQRAALMYAEAILYSVGNQLDEQDSPDNSDDKVIPIPESAMNQESMEQVIRFVHGEAKNGQ